MRKVKLSTCGNYVLSSKISTNNLTPENYITTDNMLPDKAGIIYSENIPKNTRVTQFLKDDILLSNIRPYFKKIWLAEYTGGCSADVLVFRTNDKYDPKYIKYCLSQDAFFAYDMAGSKGSKMPRGDKNHILNFELLDYDIATQKNIGNLLLSIDNKIKINNKINTELEKFAKTLYEYWFIQFDFPDEFGRPYKSSGGAMVYNDVLKREIPVKWKVENISKYCNIIDCLHSKKPDYCYEAKDLYLLQLENLTNSGYIDITNKYYISKDDYKYWTQKIEIQENDFVFTNAGRTGAFGKIPKGIKCALGRNLTAIRPISISPYYLRMFFGSNDMRQQILSNLDCGAFFKSFNVKSIKLIVLLIPQKNILNDFILKISPIIKQIEINNIETQFLTETRGFLLPMLMNGQVTIQQ